MKYHLGLKKKKNPKPTSAGGMQLSGHQRAASTLNESKKMPEKPSKIYILVKLLVEILLFAMPAVQLVILRPLLNLSIVLHAKTWRIDL